LSPSDGQSPDPYEPFISQKLIQTMETQLIPIDGVPGLQSLGPLQEGESAAALAFAQKLYLRVKSELRSILQLRKRDRDFLDTRIKACADFNNKGWYRF
jgi:hypothetical protein